MEPPFKSLIYLILAAILVSSCNSNCEQLSTVFVLETSDSSLDSSPTALIGQGVESSTTTHSNKSSSTENSNTRIITDDNNQSFNGQSTASDVEKPLNDDYKQSETQTVSSHSPVKVVKPYSQNQPQQQQQQQQSAQPRNSSGSSIAIRDTQTQDPRQRESTTRKIDAETPAQTQNRLKIGSNPSREASTNQSQQQQQQQPQQQPQRRSTTTTTTTSSYDRDQAYGTQQVSTPKTEERLLISITSDDDDYKPPHKQIGSSSLLGGDDQPQPPKRKPSITISIQDSNINKQNGQAVIVRPSENGQSIVISTVGGATLDTGHLTSTGSSLGINQNNKFNQNKPILISQQQNNNNNNNPEPPYIESIPSHQQTHITSSTTYRPSLVNNNNNNNDYNSNSNSNRPITSTLLDQPARPPVLVGGDDERPQRPMAINTEDISGYESQSQRPTSRPVNRPIAQQDSGSSFGSGGDIEVQSSGNQQSTEVSRFPLNERNCGLVHETKIVGGEEADPDDFLWMAAIVKSKPSNGEARPFCGGSLITRRHILTAAHCLENLAPRDVLVRLGSYDFDDNTASSLSMDYAIDQFRVPAQYSKKTHVADIAIMRLKTPLSTTDNYKTVCMPQPRRSYVGALGTVTGYGSQSQTFRRAAPKLRQVTVPIWENRKCSVVYKKNLTESFLCAGYEEGGKDACQGDSGGPIMTEGPNERMMVVGVVSHGIGCGSPGYPGVYTRTTTFLDWIEKNTKE